MKLKISIKEIPTNEDVDQMDEQKLIEISQKLLTAMRELKPAYDEYVKLNKPASRIATRLRDVSGKRKEIELNLKCNIVWPKFDDSISEYGRPGLAYFLESKDALEVCSRNSFYEREYLCNWTGPGYYLTALKKETIQGELLHTATFDRLTDDVIEKSEKLLKERARESYLTLLDVILETNPSLLNN
jgi:hypothetical protein